eukprot:CAMPEP_0202913936 /NCGR_PEP_ID=MMETSP1392-20130828/61853_1 /ASSEMBLY_ACC=CAM_ASM_000868 /TAXON_ID=225041 /ORGANISM="Chlamydomonas chlamydogama, Strain SAG 11-48b" /LENGTH=95 /DNA_ID=CAMNT_0049605399 /DNA_START=601 /DNA_END=884 /DNA_ORIENTATION=-
MVCSWHAQALHAACQSVRTACIMLRSYVVPPTCVQDCAADADQGEGGGGEFSGGGLRGGNKRLGGGERRLGGGERTRGGGRLTGGGFGGGEGGGG